MVTRAKLLGFVGLSVMLFTGAQAVTAQQQQTKIVVSQTHPGLIGGEDDWMSSVPRELGWFAKAGLDVTFRGLQGGTASAQVAQSGSAQFATTQAEVVMQNREQGGDLIAVFNLRRHLGAMVAVLDDSPIQKLEDLKGKTVAGLTYGSGGGKYLVRTLEQLGIGQNDYTRVVTAPGAGAAAALRGKRVDALVLWDAAFAEIENQGVKLRYLQLPGLEKMASYVLAARQSYVEANPKLVEDFCRAFTRGLYFARINPEATEHIFIRQFPQIRPSSVPHEQMVKNLMHVMEAHFSTALMGLPVEAKDYGVFIPETWKASQEYYIREGLLKGTKPPEEAYTNKFIPACNDFDRAEVAKLAREWKP
jgi:NitT/TauT family transport system substrate-binding protein